SISMSTAAPLIVIGVATPLVLPFFVDVTVPNVWPLRLIIVEFLRGFRVESTEYFFWIKVAHLPIVAMIFVARDRTVAPTPIIGISFAFTLVTALTSPMLTFGVGLFFLVISIITILPLVFTLIILISFLGTFEMNIPIMLHMVRDIVMVH
ncbi:MAG: hypothetical protein GY874_01845, partial [Desulfobacteraceae bacterium]|nr:hypothetical protein [Desulfobacteraceae bacterium]